MRLLPVVEIISTLVKFTEYGLELELGWGDCDSSCSVTEMTGGEVILAPDIPIVHSVFFKKTWSIICRMKWPPKPPALAASTCRNAPYTCPRLCGHFTTK